MSFVAFKKTKMRTAVCSGHLEKVRELLDKGVSPDLLLDDGFFQRTVLNEAFDRHFFRIALLLIQRGAQVDNDHALHASRAGRCDILAELIKKGVTMHGAIHEAAQRGHLVTVSFLLEQEPDLLHDRVAGATALHRAAESGHAKVAVLLLEKGLDPNIMNGENRTALFLAQRENCREVEALLLPVTRSVVAPAAADEKSGWQKLAADKIAQVFVGEKIGYRITDVFNFKARDRIRIVQNLETKNETVETTGFDEIVDKTSLEEALAELNCRGGAVEYGSISGLLKGKHRSL